MPTGHLSFNSAAGPALAVASAGAGLEAVGAEFGLAPAVAALGADGAAGAAPSSDFLQPENGAATARQRKMGMIVFFMGDFFTMMELILTEYPAHPGLIA